MGIETKTPDVD